MKKSASALLVLQMVVLVYVHTTFSYHLVVYCVIRRYISIMNNHASCSSNHCVYSRIPGESTEATVLLILQRSVVPCVQHAIGCHGIAGHSRPQHRGTNLDGHESKRVSYLVGLNKS